MNKHRLNLKSSYIQIISASLVCAIIIAWSGSIYNKKSDSEAVFKAFPNKKLVIIDAGHGGEDGGAIAKDGTPEKDFNLMLSYILKQFFELDGYTVIMTRTDAGDTDGEEGFIKRQDILNRLKIGNKYPDTLFISIHINKSGADRDKGFQVFYGAKNKRSKEYAEKIQQEIINASICSRVRDVVKSPSTVFLQQNLKNPSVLVECGFICNPEDFALLNDKIYCEKLMYCVFSAVTTIQQ